MDLCKYLIDILILVPESPSLSVKGLSMTSLTLSWQLHGDIEPDIKKFKVHFIIHRDCVLFNGFITFLTFCED